MVFRHLVMWPTQCKTRTAPHLKLAGLLDITKAKQMFLGQFFGIKPLEKAANTLAGQHILRKASSSCPLGNRRWNNCQKQKGVSNQNKKSYSNGFNVEKVEGIDKMFCNTFLSEEGQTTSPKAL